MTEISRWVRTTADAAALAERLQAGPVIALDTESDSLYHYPARLCLVQIADAGGGAYLLDPLILADYSALGPVLTDPRILKVVHAGDNDLLALRQRFGFKVTPLFDTYLAARFVGLRELGLDVLLERFLGVRLGASRQKDDWSVRPLSSVQETYALDDVRHLIPLRERLLDALTAAGREGWLGEECEALSRIEPAPKLEKSHAYLAIKGARALPARSRAVLHELHTLRDELALSLDRPPFKVLSNEVLTALAAARPRDLDALSGVPGCSPRVVSRFGDAILSAIARGEALPHAQLPVLPRRGRPSVPAAVRKRVDALRRWRGGAADQCGLDPGVLLPGRLIERIAETAPRDLEALSRIDGVRQWRIPTFGAEIVAAVASADTDSPRYLALRDDSIPSRSH